MYRIRTTPVLTAALMAFGLCNAFGSAQTMPTPAASAMPAASTSPSPAASASPAPRPGSIRWSIDAHTTFVTQGASGPGTRPVEAAGFAAGDPLSPQTPYDVFSSAPLVPGNAS